MKVASLKQHIPWSLSGITPFLNTYGDRLLFGSITRTKPIKCNPESETGIHSAVPHKFLYAYLVAIKSLLRFHADLAVHVHDDGSLRNDDKELIRQHVPGVRIIDRAEADRTFDETVGDEFLAKVRKSYTSYLKLFDPTLFSNRSRIIIVDTDVLFLSEPAEIIHWAKAGGPAWYHQSGSWLNKISGVPSAEVRLPDGASTAKPQHIQTRVVDSIEKINVALRSNFKFVPGFNSGFIGYERGVVDYSELKTLLTHLYGIFGDAIFRWGSEQTMHGLVLCGKGAEALPLERYMVFTDLSAGRASQAAFVHFIGEFRFNRLIYPRLALGCIRELRGG